MAGHCSHTTCVIGVLIAIATAACGSSDQSTRDRGGDGAKGDTCQTGSECQSGVCAGGRCTAASTVPDGRSGEDCTFDAECASGSCSKGVCAKESCVDDEDCLSRSCVAGECVPATYGGDGQFLGGGEAFRPLKAGCGPETATLCTGACEGGEGTQPADVIRPPATLCFYGEGDETEGDPAAVVEQVVEAIEESTYVHIRVVFDPSYVDNTYGAGTSSGWFAGGDEPGPDEPGPDKPGADGKPKPGKGHTFNDLVGSDHTELLLTDGSGATVLEFKLDLVSEDPDAPCGYGTLGVSGGEGKIITGNASDVLAVATSISRNLNGCGYCQVEACNGDCRVDSPATDDLYTPNPGTPNWDYRQEYEAWISLDAFGAAGFGQAYITYTHASPSKVGVTLDVEPAPCPPDWCLEGDTSCYGGPDGEGLPPDGDACPPNEQVYTSAEGEELCTPIPFANYPGMAACPDGYVLDLASEGRYCLPEQ